MFLVGDSEAETSGPMAPLCIGTGIGPLGRWTGAPRAAEAVFPPPRLAGGAGARTVGAGPEGPTWKF